MAVLTPSVRRLSVWALSISLAATLKIDVSFSSSGYLDVSVHRVPLLTLWIRVRIHEVCSCGFPHSDILGSAYLQLPEAFRSLSRLSSALSAKASTLRSYSLNQRFAYIALYALGLFCVYLQLFFENINFR